MLQTLLVDTRPVARGGEGGRCMAQIAWGTVGSENARFYFYRKYAWRLWSNGFALVDVSIAWKLRKSDNQQQRDLSFKKGVDRGCTTQIVCHAVRDDPWGDLQLLDIPIIVNFCEWNNRHDKLGSAVCTPQGPSVILNSHLISSLYSTQIFSKYSRGTRDLRGTVQIKSFLQGRCWLYIYKLQV